jgi:amino acid transporter
MSLATALFGRPLRSEEEHVESLSPATGVPVLGLDALGSASYGPEAALTVLLPLGTLAAVYVGPLLACVALLLFIVFASYLQTIAAYPGGGGSFTVAKENLGPLSGLVAAAALSVDYVLNVAVAIAAGVGALVSTIPELQPHTLMLCLVILLLLTLANLRGVRSAGILFMLPTYAFVACLAATIVWGIVKVVAAGGHPEAVARLAQPSPREGTVSLWLLLHAFASGCTALTGVEAVSNAVPLFREPKVARARRTLTVIVVLLALLIAGIAVLTRAYAITATPPGQEGYQSVLSQVVAAVAGRGAFYFVTMGSILSVLALSANTSFADFPRVCRALAVDEFLPRGFARRGRRLVYTSGVLVLAVLSGALLVVFGGVTDHLIPLFAVGAFGAFTLSQAGMVVHWRRVGGKNAGRKLAINALGAAATGSTLLIIAVSKFSAGAWLTLIVIPPLVLFFLRVRQERKHITREARAEGPLDLANLAPPIVILPVRSLDSVDRKALRLALTLSEDVRAVHVLADDRPQDDLQDRWAKLVAEPARASGRQPPELVVLPSAYRKLFAPLIDYVKKLALDHPDRHVAVVVAEMVQRRWFQPFVRHRTTLLKQLLLMKGTPQLVIVNVPWYLRE